MKCLRTFKYLLFPILLLVFFSILFIIFKSFKDSRILKSTTPGLYVEGPLIKRKDTGTPVQLKGVTTMAFVRYNYIMEELLHRFEVARGWGSNLIGLFLDYQITKDKIKDIDKIVEWTRNNNMYLYLIPTVDARTVKGQQLIYQATLFPEIMDILSRRYKDETHILYGLWAEPQIMIWDFWNKQATDIADKIRNNDPDAILLMTGTMWGRYFDTDKNPFNFDNVIYDFHDYPWADKKEASLGLKSKNIEFLWERFIDKYPVLIGEFGGVYLQDFGSDEDIEYTSKILDNVNKNKLNYSAYTIDDEGELGLINWKTGESTRKGSLIINDLKNYPPTRIQ